MKRKNIAIILVSIGGIMLLLSSILLLNDDKYGSKDYNNTEENIENDDDDEKEEINTEIITEELDINTKEVREAYELIKLVDFSEYNYTLSKKFVSFVPEYFFYSRMKITPTDFDEWNAFGVYIHDFLDFYDFEYEDNDSHNTCELSKIKKSELEKALYKLFGTNYSIENFGKDKYFRYIEEEDAYSFGGCFGDTTAMNIHTKLVKAEKKGDYMYLYEKIGMDDPLNYSNPLSYFSSSMDEINIQKPLNGKSIWEYEDYLSTFMYKLKKDENGEYHLESMEYFELK